MSSLATERNADQLAGELIGKLTRITSGLSNTEVELLRAALALAAHEGVVIGIARMREAFKHIGGAA